MTRSRRLALGIAVTLFLASRFHLLFRLQPDQSDMFLYVQYAWEDEVARSQDRPLYPFHAEQFDRARAFARANGAAGPPEETRSIEYPPLALQSVLVPKRFIARPMGVSAGRHDWPLYGPLDGYDRAFRAFMAAVDAVCFVGLLLLVPRLYPGEGGPRQLERWVTYIGAGHLLGHVLYDRLSLPAGAFLLAALGAMVLPRAPWIAGFAFLAAAVGYQLSPLVLVPLFALGSLSIPRLRAPLSALLTAGAGRVVLALSLTAALFVPFYVREGTESLGFLRYHGLRGLHIESVAATLPLLLSFAGHEVRPVGEFGAVHLRSSLAPFLAGASPALMAALVLGVAAVLLRRVQRRPDAATVHFAARYGPAFAGFVVASLAAAMIGSKVFSPQYLLWLLPLVPLMPGRSRWLFVAVAAVTTAIFPYAYVADVAELTTFGKLLLITRNTLFVWFGLLALRDASRAI